MAATGMAEELAAQSDERVASAAAEASRLALCLLQLRPAGCRQNEGGPDTQVEFFAID